MRCREMRVWKLADSLHDQFNTHACFRLLAVRALKIHHGQQAATGLDKKVCGLVMLNFKQLTSKQPVVAIAMPGDSSRLDKGCSQLQRTAAQMAHCISLER